MREFYFKDSELWCEDVLLKDIADRFGTPLYVYSKRSIIDHCQQIERVFGGLDHLSCYAVKANANRSLLRVIAEQGTGADVGSAGELHAALDAGFSPDKITYSSVGKRNDEIEFALCTEILALNVESEGELAVINDIAQRLRTRASIVLRVNFDIDAGTHPHITTGLKSNKFGVEAGKAEGLLRGAKHLSHVEVLGIHSHMGSQITDSGRFVKVARQAVALVDRLRAAGIPVQYLNFGGGFGVQYHDFIIHPLLPRDGMTSESGLTTVGLLQAVLPVLNESKCKIFIQPGRSIIAHAGILITKILYTKENGGKKFVIVDAGMNDLIRPSLYDSYHQIVPLHLKNVNHEVVDVVGPLCESGDYFARDRMIPWVECSEYLAVLCTGAYGYALASNYNMRPRPAEVLVDGARAQQIRARENVLEL